jgi:hypothetical protein
LILIFKIKEFPWREIIKITAKINEIETRKPIQKNQQNKQLFFEKTNKIDKLLANIIK